MVLMLSADPPLFFIILMPTNVFLHSYVNSTRPYLQKADSPDKNHWTARLLLEKYSKIDYNIYIRYCTGFEVYMNFDYKKTAERLKMLRREKKLSHEKLSAVLKVQYGISLSRASLIDYENTDVQSVKAGAAGKMSVDRIAALADFYGVSTDYLLGRSDIRSRDESAKALMDYTDLSEPAIQALHDRYSKQSIQALNLLLTKCGDSGQYTLAQLCDMVAAACAIDAADVSDSKTAEKQPSQNQYEEAVRTLMCTGAAPLGFSELFAHYAHRAGFLMEQLVLGLRNHQSDREES